MEVSTPPSSSPHRLTRLERFYSQTNAFGDVYDSDRELKVLRCDGPTSLVPDVYPRTRAAIKDSRPGVRTRRGKGSETGRRKGSESMANMNGQEETMSMPPRLAVVSSGSLPPMEDATEGSPGGASLDQSQDEDAFNSRPRRTSQSRTQSHTKKSKSSSSQAPLDPSIATLLREKDLRIQNLESQILRLETEFHTQISKQSQSEAENTIYWQQKCSLEHRKFLEADTELRLLKEQRELREMEREEVKKGYEVLRGRLAGRDEEVVGLRAQVRGLKDFVSMSTRTDGVQVKSDKALGEAMGKLVYGLQQWVVTSYRKGKLREWGDVLPAVREEVCALCPVFEGVAKREEGRVNKVHLLQGIVSGVLVKMVFGGYFAGLSEEDERKFHGLEEVMKGFGLPEESLNQWRASTLATLRREAPSLQEAPEEFTRAVTGRIMRLLGAILDMTAALPPSTEGTLRQLVGSAIDLSRLLSVQKAVLTVYFPEVRRPEGERRVAVVKFDHASMEDIGGEEVDEEEEEGGDMGAGGGGLAGREICCVVFPGLVKRGDENGGSLEYRNVIAKARVLCAGLED